MIYTAKTKKALKLMFEAHKYQKDRGKMPYVFHPYEVASQMDDEDSVIVALLHDIIEDYGYSLSYLKTLEFSDKVIQAIDLLTHKETDTYDEYINKVSTNYLARKVKIADLKHNMDLTRLYNITEKDIERNKKYERYLHKLEDREKEHIDELIDAIDSLRYVKEK